MTQSHAKVLIKGEINMLDKNLLAEEWEDFEDINKSLLKTEFQDLDVILGLNENRGALITIGARPAMGKTTFMLSIAEKLLEKKKKVMLYSLEMSDKQMIKRLLILTSEVDSSKVRLKHLSASDFENLARNMDKISEWDLYIDDTPYITVDKIEEQIKEVKPEIVFIDYLQLMAGNKKKDRYSQIEDICLNLKRIAKENDVIIFMASQLSRAVENRYDKRPMLSDLRESGAIENISDVVIFLYRDAYYNFMDKEDELIPKGETEVIVAKNKFGCCGTVHITFNANIPKFYNKIVEIKF